MRREIAVDEYAVLHPEAGDRLSVLVLETHLRVAHRARVDVEHELAAGEGERARDDRTELIIGSIGRDKTVETLDRAINRGSFLQSLGGRMIFLVAEEI